MEQLSFNEWMLYIRQELNYPKEKLKEYEQSIRGQASVSSNQRWSNQNRDRTHARSYVGATIPENN